MAKKFNEPFLVPSVLDRLLDDEPENDREVPQSRSQLLRELKQSVRRDLENLLNTRYRCVSWPPDLDELEASLVNYGIPDFTGISMGAPESREELRRVVERVIERFESRFKSVRVRLIESDEEFDRMLRFRIDGLLQVEPSPEPVVFDSQLEPASGSVQVKSER